MCSTLATARCKSQRIAPATVHSSNPTVAGALLNELASSPGLAIVPVI